MLCNKLRPSRLREPARCGREPSRLTPVALPAQNDLRDVVSFKGKRRPAGFEGLARVDGLKQTDMEFDALASHAALGRGLISAQP
jgi:hypothetical protein